MPHPADRFSRHYALEGFGKEAQDRLRGAKVLVVGAGGLGCPALLYLAAAGIGLLGIADGDSVEASNLNRQVLFGIDDVGRQKALRAAERLQALYPDVNCRPYPDFILPNNALDLIGAYDLVLDGSDNLPTRYLLDDATRLLGKPLVSGAVYRWEGQVGVFNWGEGAPCYRDLHPEKPDSQPVPNCHEQGVVGVLPGIIGCLQAAEAIKVLTGCARPLAGQVLAFSLEHDSFRMDVRAGQPHRRPESAEAFREWPYGGLPACHRLEVGWDDALRLLEKEGGLLLDVREEEERPALSHPALRRAPLSRMQGAAPACEGDGPIFVCCQTGVRSLSAAERLSEAFPQRMVRSIRGGVRGLGAEAQLFLPK